MTQNSTTAARTITAPITVEQLMAEEIDHGLTELVIRTARGFDIGVQGPSVGFVIRNNFDDDFAGFVRFVNEPALCGVELPAAHALGDRCTKPAGHAGRLHGEAAQ